MGQVDEDGEGEDGQGHPGGGGVGEVVARPESAQLNTDFLNVDFLGLLRFQVWKCAKNTNTKIYQSVHKMGKNMLKFIEQI